MPRLYSTAVSLHSHTSYSRESLDFIPKFAARNPLTHWALSEQKKRCKKVPADFATAYWTPPLTARAAYELERSQIENELNLASIVSLTDHDSIEAPLELRNSGLDVPIGIEWSVPVDDIEVHIGIHNLPAKTAQQVVADMHEYTANPREPRLKELLVALCADPRILVVLNHPLWDISSAGPIFLNSLDGVLRKYNEFFHAYELNGLRSKRENDGVVGLAHAWNKPLISGGDRHGCEANAVVNLTRAESMAEFVGEVRDGHSHVLFMPCYRESLTLRTIQSVIDVVQDYPCHPRGSAWDNRVFHRDRSGNMQPLSALWNKPPQFIGTAFSLLRMIEETALRWNRRLIRDRAHVSQQLFFRAGDEAA